ncbi:hypothetical protein FSP39_022518 [Pinctada imbricata]|uniref:Sodium-dependent glucose transporter 1 n=1 Tax=Pinctada imbricata TaxID=66713 RepID=A0AA88YF97_PINIB|nr:hypothetical protein FSP39_022518 [Pinctada imbricata]
MMRESEEDEVLSDQEGLLDRRKKTSNISQWCHRFTKTVCLSLAFFTLVRKTSNISQWCHRFTKTVCLSLAFFTLWCHRFTKKVCLSLAFLTLVRKTSSLSQWCHRFSKTVCLSLAFFTLVRKTSSLSQWCHRFTKTVCLSLAFFTLVRRTSSLSQWCHRFTKTVCLSLAFFTLVRKTSSLSQWCHRFSKTVCLSLAFFTLGLCIAIPGPTFIDLQQRIESDTTHTALIFTARSIGYLLGSLVGGFLFDYFDKQLMLTMTLFIAALATAIIPWSLTLTVLCVMFVLQGTSMGVLDTGGNVFCVRIWGKKSPPYMQAMHFAFGIGAFVAPLMSQPFLSDMPILSRSTSIPPNFNSPLDALHSNSSLFSRHVRDLDGITDTIPPVGAFINDTDKYNVTYNGTEVTIESTTMLVITTVGPSMTKKVKKPTHSDTSDFDGKTNDGKQIKPHLDQEKSKIDKKNDQPPPPKSSDADQVKTTTSSEAVTPPTDSLSVNDTHLDSNSTEQVANVSSDESNNSSTTTFMSSTSSNGISKTTQSTTGQTSSKTTTTRASDIETSQEQPTTTILSTTLLTTTTEPSTTTTTTSTTTTPTTTKKPTTPTTTTTVQTTTKVPTTTSAPTTTTTTSKPETRAPTKKPDSSGSSTKSVSSTTTQLSNSNETEITSENPISSTTTNVKKPSHSISGIISAVKNMSRIQFAYLIIGALLLLNSFLFMVLYCYDRHHSDYSSLVKNKYEQDPQEILCCRIIILVLMFLFFLSYVGMETTFGGLLMTFVVTHIHWSKNQGAIVTAIFWGSLAVGRGFSIFIANCCKPGLMLITDLVLLLIGALMLSFGLKFQFVVWLGTLAVGFGMSSIFPTSISWMEQYYRLTGKSTAVLVMGSAFGQMIIPVVTGYFYQNVEPMSLMYALLVLSVFMLVLYSVMQLVASRTAKGGTASQNGFMHLRDDDNLELDDISYGTTQESTRRRFMPTFSDEAEYNKLLQDEDDDIDLLG